MPLVDDSPLYFDIPARDALGLENVMGKLHATQEGLLFYWRLKDRTFQKVSQEMAKITISYQDVESLEMKTVLFGFKPRLIFKVTNPELLHGVPGTDVGRAILYLQRKYNKDARKFIKTVDYFQSEAQARISLDRLSEIDEREPR